MSTFVDGKATTHVSAHLDETFSGYIVSCFFGDDEVHERPFIHKDLAEDYAIFWAHLNRKRLISIAPDYPL